MQYELGFIGAGNMAEAIARAAIEQGVLEPRAIIAADPSQARRKVFEALGITVVDDAGEVAASAREVMIAVKPQVLEKIEPALQQVNREAQVLISIMAGVRCERIEQVAGGAARVIRVMPNTPVMVGVGMAAVAAGRHARSGDEALTVRLFEAAGRAVRMDEAAMDAVTAVSGSGPAYLFYLAEAMEQAAVRMGLERDARLLIGQTLLGAATLLMQGESSAAELRQRVTSPGGTTEAALARLDARDVVNSVIEAMEAARDRSVELGR